MSSSSNWRSRLAGTFGDPDATEQLTANTWRVVAGGHNLVVKVGDGVADEAEGLRRLAAVDGAPPVPEVVLIDVGVLVTTWIEQGIRTGAHEENLGRGLAQLHSRPYPNWGGGSAWIGACPVEPRVTQTAATFYRQRLSDLAARCGLVGPIQTVLGRLDELIPPGVPHLVHGDLWWGNVLWGADGRAWLIDPSIHGGHPEEDLAMLALFGVVPSRLLGAYGEVSPLAEGWEERVGLFQLYPLLVHAVLFGGSYRRQVEAIASRFA